MKLQLAIGLFSGLLAACNPIDIGSQNGLAATETPNAGSEAPNCAQCHAYPPRDILHQFHLTAYVVHRDGIANPALNGPVTCLDCHYTSVRSFAYTVAESTWVDSNENELSGPGPGALLRVKTHRKHRPLPYPAQLDLTGAAVTDGAADSMAKLLDTLVLREARAGRIVKWMTALAHMDGKAGVSFAPNNLTDSTRRDSAFVPLEQSCSSVACHNRANVRYRWAAPSRGISGCPSLMGDDPTCGETP